MKKSSQKTTWMIVFVSVLLGFFLVQALNKPKIETEIEGVSSLKNIEKLLKEKNELEQKRKELEQYINRKITELTMYEDQAIEANIKLQELQSEVQEKRLLAGLLAVEGPGVEIILNDRQRDSFLSNNPSLISYFIVHDSDMLHIINELRGAGAEAIAVNGTRIMPNSRISCGGPTIHVGKYERFAPPFIIHAIGDPDRLYESFQEEGSIYHDLAAWGLEIKIQKMDRLEIPRYLGETEYTYARVREEDE
ncbi:MAG: DUF881 domain-containing protein [Caldicoprobacterales bacterium]|jgi:uncharacterized protein YlxW (UPF0749 family)|nr:DUF881 domain-containing protein [Clostridiales bacterium]